MIFIDQMMYFNYVKHSSWTEIFSGRKGVVKSMIFRGVLCPNMCADTPPPLERKEFESVLENDF